MIIPGKPEVNAIKRGSTDADRPDRLDSKVWKRLFISTHFGDSTTELCNAFAEIIKSLCTTENLSSVLELFLSCHLIPLKSAQESISWIQLFDTRQAHKN